MPQKSQEMGRAPHGICTAAQRALEMLQRKTVPQEEQEMPRF